MKKRKDKENICKQKCPCSLYLYLYCHIQRYKYYIFIHIFRLHVTQLIVSTRTNIKVLHVSFRLQPSCQQNLYITIIMFIFYQHFKLVLFKYFLCLRITFRKHLYLENPSFSNNSFCLIIYKQYNYLYINNTITFDIFHKIFLSGTTLIVKMSYTNFSFIY